MQHKSFGPKPWLIPQPVLIIGTYDANGIPNAMNAAWGGTWDAHEIMISLGKHATTDNLNLHNGEFTVSFATTDSMVAADFVGIVSASKDPSKMDKTGWKCVKAPNVDAPLFDCFPMTLECRTAKRIDESETGFYLIAEVVNVLCGVDFLDANGNPDVAKMHCISYEPVNHKYVELGKVVGDAFSCGKSL